ncbi:unnamed protein product [Mesocestoides corti]|uniref:Uncharacterized protein n=1 Tax=Mesocestoides corti TaxID=53468 RepID=A0A0R3UN41_MESCO|nr:unnamed protein product [Mesocestoides corti]
MIDASTQPPKACAVTPLPSQTPGKRTCALKGDAMLLSVHNKLPRWARTWPMTQPPPHWLTSYRVVQILRVRARARARDSIINCLHGLFDFVLGARRSRVINAIQAHAQTENMKFEGVGQAEDPVLVQT